MPKKLFEKGPDERRGKGGARRNAGRKPDWLKRLCQQELAAKNAKGIKLIAKISRNEVQFEKLFNDDGMIVRAKIGGTAGEIIQANEFLRDTGVGKPTQAIEWTGENVVNLIDAIREARTKRGLPLE